uniref:RING-type domain-containing protein n=1 Tax=Astyanax mexicanus TaxID=7994 RepID=A0A8B9JUM2_ASTMX
MASSLSTLKRDLQCPVCIEIFKDPVILSCSHSFCRTCVQRSWRRSPGRQCPLCSRRSSKDHPLSNLTLKNTCESFLQQKKKEEGSSLQGALCSLHLETVNLFCVDDQQLICGKCVSADHLSHSFCSLSKAADFQKETLHSHLTHLNKNLSDFNKAKAAKDLTLQQTEKQMKQEFEKLHQFLRREEEVQISDLRQEVEEKSQSMKKSIEELEKQIKEISTLVKEREERKKDAALFLQAAKTASERFKNSAPDFNPNSQPQINVVPHLDNLSYRVWEKIKHSLSADSSQLNPTCTSDYPQPTQHYWVAADLAVNSTEFPQATGSTTPLKYADEISFEDCEMMDPDECRPYQRVEYNSYTANKP